MGRAVKGCEDPKSTSSSFDRAGLLEPQFVRSPVAHIPWRVTWRVLCTVLNCTLALGRRGGGGDA